MRAHEVGRARREKEEGGGSASKRKMRVMREREHLDAQLLENHRIRRGTLTLFPLSLLWEIRVRPPWHLAHELYCQTDRNGLRGGARPRVLAM
jgi:hypothetical protein